jgi:formylglycine-generating enzyme required for sulfatase activity
MGRNPSWFSPGGEGRREVKNVPPATLNRFPVETISWDDAQEFLKRLNAREKGKGWRYRLPTSAEWEYACRGAATTRAECSFEFYWERPTNDITLKDANISVDWVGGELVPTDRQLGRPTAVGSYRPNKLGLHDMHGNVMQWCDNADGGKTQPLRGGAWASLGYTCSAGYAVTWRSGDIGYDIGMRVVRVRAGGQE